MMLEAIVRPEAGTRYLAPDRLASIEAFENALLLGRRYPGAPISNVDEDGVSAAYASESQPANPEANISGHYPEAASRPASPDGGREGPTGTCSPACDLQRPGVDFGLH